MGSAQNHEVENSRGVWGDSKVIMRIKKRPYIVRKCGRCKVLNSNLFLGFQRMPNFAFFKGSDDAEISQKHIVTLYGHYSSNQQL